MLNETAAADKSRFMGDAPEVKEYLKGLTVLFVEDEEFTRELCSEFLERIVGVLITAKNGLEGLEAYRKHNPAIIMTDIQMPFMDGLSMLEEIRRRDMDVPVIILSAFDESDYLKRSIDLGVNGYVLKPVNIARFTESLLKCARVLRAEAALRFQERLNRSTLDGLNTNICVINGQGTIITTNRAWDDFAAENGAVPGTCSEGSNYLESYRVAAKEGQGSAETFRDGMTAVLNGTLPEFTMEYQCSAPGVERWYICTVKRFEVDGLLYAVISHSDSTDLKLARDEIGKITDDKRVLS